jgi:hypothetical protein
MTTNVTTDRIPAAARKPQTERHSGVEVIAARVLTVAVVALVVIALYGFTLGARSDGSSTALIVSGVFGISAAVIGLVVGFLNAHRAA